MKLVIVKKNMSKKKPFVVNYEWSDCTCWFSCNCKPRGGKKAARKGK